LSGRQQPMIYNILFWMDVSSPWSTTFWFEWATAAPVQQHSVLSGLLWQMTNDRFFPRVSRKLYVKHLRSEFFPTYIMMNKMLMFRCDKMGIFANNYHFYYIYGLSAMLIIRGCCRPLKWNELQLEQRMSRIHSSHM
jgi:hypothetical protein